jgi:hypothetical protein
VPKERVEIFSGETRQRRMARPRYCPCPPLDTGVREPPPPGIIGPQVSASTVWRGRAVQKALVEEGFETIPGDARQMHMARPRYCPCPPLDTRGRMEALRAARKRCWRAGRPSFSCHFLCVLRKCRVLDFCYVAGQPSTRQDASRDTRVGGGLTRREQRHAHDDGFPVTQACRRPETRPHEYTMSRWPAQEAQRPGPAGLHHAGVWVERARHQTHGFEACQGGWPPLAHIRASVVQGD